MDSYEDFFTRANDVQGFNRGLYKTKISSGSSSDKDKLLFNECFSDHVNIFDPSIEELEYNKDTNDRHIKSDHLSAYFINKIYKTPKITDYDSGDTISFDELISNFIGTSNSNENENDVFRHGSNRIRFIVGEVGEGKSAFLQKVNYEIEKKRTDWEDGYDVLTIRMDLEKKYNCENLTEPKPIKSDFLEFLYNLIREQVESRVGWIDRAKLKAYDAAASTNYQLTIKRLIKFLKEEKIRLVLLIDNLDFYHYYYARYAFFDEHHRVQQASISNNIEWLINIFQSINHLGDQGLNVMFAVRSHVYDDINSPRGIENSKDSTRAVKIAVASESVVLQTRFKLFSEAIMVVIKNNPSRESILKDYLAYLKSKLLGTSNVSGSVIEAIGSLGQHGNRNLVRFFSSLNIGYNDNELIERFFDRKVSTLQIMYFNNMNKKYSQRIGHFPNLFLNDCVVKVARKGFEDAHQPHMHTYWLKYFILKYLEKYKSVKINKVIKVFCIDGEYDEFLVRHILGSICTSNETGCAEIEEGDEEETFESRKIKLTSRAKVLLGEYRGADFCFNSMYLQVVIDDMWLCYPKEVADKIFLPESEYSYLYHTGRKYRVSATNNTIKKTYAMIEFIKVLEDSFLVEIEKNKPKLFAILEDLDAIPDFKRINSNILDYAKAVVGLLRKEDANKITEIEIYLEYLNSKISYKAFFEKYYESMIKVMA